MTQTPEGWVKDHIQTFCTADAGVYCFMPMTMGYGKSGAPDFFLSVYSVFVTIEAKDDAYRHRHGELITRGKNKGKRVTEGGPTALQQETMKEIRDAGGITLCVDQHNYTKLPAFFVGVREIMLKYPGNRALIVKHARNLDLWYEWTPEL